MNGLIYDIEIVNAIPDPREDRIPGITYCGGWTDFANMGIAVIAVYDLLEKRSLVFLEDGLSDFQDLAKNRDCIIGYNSLRFDDKLLQANGIAIQTTYDFCVEIKKSATGRSGYGLDNMCKANLNRHKPMQGALAPVLWQQGEKSQVISYCLWDVDATRALLSKAFQNLMVDPNSGHPLTVDLSGLQK